jgi:hypothetical protein
MIRAISTSLYHEVTKITMVTKALSKEHFVPGFTTFVAS